MLRMTLGSVPQDGLTALILAVKEGHTETVRTLLAAGADVNLQEEVNKCNYASCTNRFQTTQTFWVPRTHKYMYQQYCL